MSDNSVDDITRELSRFGNTALQAFWRWRRANPTATRVPRGVWREMEKSERADRKAADKAHRAEKFEQRTAQQAAKLRARHLIEDQAVARREERARLYTHLDRSVENHAEAVRWSRAEVTDSPEEYWRGQWELVRRREELEWLVQSSPVLTPEERGQAIKAIAAAHRIDQPGVNMQPVRLNTALSGLAALRARLADRLSWRRLGITDRGSVPAQPSPHEMTRRREELARLVHAHQDMRAVREVLRDRLSERGPLELERVAILDAKYQRNVQELAALTTRRLNESGITYTEWRQVYRDLTYRPSEQIENLRRLPDRDLEAAWQRGTADSFPARVALWAHPEPDWRPETPQALTAPSPLSIPPGSVVGTSGRVWTAIEVHWYGPAMDRDQLERTFAMIDRDGYKEIADLTGWSEDVERARFTIDTTGVLTTAERDRAMTALSVFETEAKLGQKPDRPLWDVVTRPEVYDQWNNLTPSQPPQAPEQPTAAEVPDLPEPPETPDPPQPGLIGRTRALQDELPARTNGAAQTPTPPDAPTPPAVPEGSVVVQAEVFEQMRRDLDEIADDRRDLLHRMRDLDNDLKRVRKELGDVTGALDRVTEERDGLLLERDRWEAGTPDPAAEVPDAPEPPDMPEPPEMETVPAAPPEMEWEGFNR
ncbi:hypothetical protein [Nocardia sp. CC227C]|uniref:hypothetical protein n=1 Tax=Nocardia sp. CC227C TaxID=3044562 RepID=UPI00278C0040|nr:hypothetical protein [Nocardia sp. CC227C]